MKPGEGDKKEIDDVQLFSSYDPYKTRKPEVKKPAKKVEEKEEKDEGEKVEDKDEKGKEEESDNDEKEEKEEMKTESKPEKDIEEKPTTENGGAAAATAPDVGETDSSESNIQ